MTISKNLLCGAVLFALSTPSYAAPTTLVVPSNDLNVASAEGLARLQRRVSSAAKTVCGNSHSRELAISQAERLCRARAMEEAQPQVMRVVMVARAQRLASR